MYKLTIKRKDGKVVENEYRKVSDIMYNLWDWLDVSWGIVDEISITEKKKTAKKEKKDVEVNYFAVR